MDPKEAEILGSLGDTSARDGGGETAEAEAARQVQANRETSTFAGTLEAVTLEDVAVHFSTDEWSLLEGWQKALHQEVMQENYTLLLSLGHSVPSEELPSFIHQLEGTLEGQALGIYRDGGSDAEGEELFLAEEAVEAEGPWELDCLSNEGCLTHGSGGEGNRQSSLHLCALMKLVKEIPEFLYGHGKASADSSGSSEPGAAEVLPQHVKTEAHPENLHHGCLEADLAEVSLSLSSHPDTPTSSTEGDCAESQIRVLHIPGEVKSLSSCEGSTKSGAESRSGTPRAPARDSPPDSAPGDMEQRGAKSGVGKGILGGTDLRDPDPDTCHRGRPSSSGMPAATPLSCASSTATSPQESPADPDRQTLPSTRKEGRANRPDRVGILGSACFSSPCGTGERLHPQQVGKRACQEQVSRCTSPNPAPEAAVEEKPLQGLLRSLRELIVQQPPHSHQAACRPSTGDGQQVSRRRRRDVGSGSPPRPVKTEVADEEQRSSRRDSSDSSAQPEDSSTSISGPAGGRREHASEAQASSLFVAVKAEPTSEEESPLPGAKELPEGCRLQPPLPRSSTSYCGTEAGMELGLWVPYSEEWRPVTSPLHGLLNCLKEIPTPRPHPSNILAGKRGGGGGGGGGKDRRKGGRRGRPETLLENLLPPGPEAGLGEMPVRQPQLPNPLPSSPTTSSSLRHDTEWRKPEAGLAAEGHKEDSPSKCTSPAGPGTPLQGLERCLKELPPSSRNQPYSPAISSSLSSSPDPLLRWTPETGKWPRKEEGPQSSSTPLQGLERCLKELPSHAHNQPASPAISSSFSSSPDGLQRWVPEMGKWTRKEDGLSRSSTPLQGLGRCWKEPSPNMHSQPCSPALSSSISSSPDGLHRWTLETGKWTRKEGGVSPSSTPLPGPEGCLKGLPGTPHSPYFGPAVGTSSEEHCAPAAGRWSLKEEGPRSPRVSPLQGLENCLREIPTSGRSIPDSAHAASCFSSQKLQRAEAASPRPWAGGDPAGSFLQCPTSTRGPTDASVGRSPLLRLMSCLKGIPIQRPSYLDTPSISSSSSSCSDAERDPQSPGSAAWWDCGSDTCQGLEGDVAVESRRAESPATLPSSPKERIPSTPDSEPPLATERGVAATSPLHGLENCLKDVAVSQPRGTSVSPARAGSHGETAPRGSAAGVLRACSARSPPTSGLPSSPKDPTAGGPGCSKTQALDDGGRKWGRAVERSYLGAGRAEGGLTNSSPLQGLLRCLREIPVGGSDPHSSSAGDTRGETRPTRTEEEADPRRPSQEGASVGLGSGWKERPRSRASLATTPLSIPGREKARRSPPPAAGGGHRGVIPTSSPACGVGTCATGLSGSGSLCVLSRRAPMPKLAAQRWRESCSPKSGSKRSLMAVRTDDPQAVPCRIESREKGASRDAEPENPPKRRRPALELPLPRCGWEQHPAGVGGLGPALSQKLDRLSAEMSALCRDVSRLQTHMDRLEQDSRGWGLELAALRMENRGLSEYVRRMESRCRTLENRSRRNNLRLLGLPEGVEGGDAVSFLQKTLPAMLGLPLDLLEVESARRVQGGVPWDPNGRPRPLVFRLLRFANKAAILQAARRQPLSYAGTRVTILPDFSSSLLPRRRVPFRAVRRSRWAAELCFGPRHSSCGCAWTREPGGLLACSGPLAGEREGRGPKGTEAEKWGTATLEGPGQPGVGPSTGSFEQHNPTHK